MFISRVAELGLLEHDNDSDILSGFPLGVQRTLVTQVTQCLLPTASSATSNQLLTSPAHVRWAMEIVGQGFALPIDEAPVIWQAVEVYDSWLHDHRPVGIREVEGTDVEQRFWQTIFEQFSLIFQPRPKAEMQSSPWIPDRTKGGKDASTTPHHADEHDPVGAHVALCHAVLQILGSVGRTLGPQFSEETWIVLLKVMIGITDCLLREPVETEKSTGTVQEQVGRGDRHTTIVYDGEEPAVRMADELCEHLIRVLFELWLRSGLTRVYMWDHLKRYFTMWTHRVPVIRQWNATILGLTQRVVGLLYGTTEGAGKVYIDVDEHYSVTLDLSSEFVVYAWHRLSYIIGNPNALLAPISELSIKGIGRVVQVWHTIGSDDGPLLHEVPGVPDGNTILHMFGGWLFEATIKTAPEFADGKAEALGILCRIFCQPQRRIPFERTYLERFYTAVKEGLRSDSQALSSIVQNSSTLFSRELLEGVRLLVPDYVIALKRILKPPAVGGDVLRRAAYAVIACLLPLPNHFEYVPLGIPWERYETYGVGGPDEPILTRTIRAMYFKSQEPVAGAEPSGGAHFCRLKPHLAELLLIALHTEHEPSNSRYILHLLTMFVAEDAPFCPGLPALVVRCIQEKLTAWPPDVLRTAFQTLNSLSGYYEYIQRNNKSCPRDLVLALCRYIDTSLVEENLVSSQGLIIAAYDCMIRWVICGDWITVEQATHIAVIATLSRGIGVLDRDDDFAAVAPPLPPPHPHPSHHHPAHHQNQTHTGGSTLVNSHSSNSITTSATIGNFRDLASMAGGAGSAGNTVSDKKKVPRHSMAASKLLPKLRGAHVAGPTTGSGGSVSTGTRDAGLGLPTFASLTAEMMIKGAAESALGRMVNMLGNFPPFGEASGVAAVGSVWDEEKELKRIVSLRKSLIEKESGKQADDEENPVSLADYRRYMRYYAFDKRTILGILETPAWARPVASSSDALVPAMTLVLRDSSGKYTWMSTVRYVEEGEEVSTRCSLVRPENTSMDETVAGIHVLPQPYPYSPLNAIVRNRECVNASAVPPLDTGVDVDAWEKAVKANAPELSVETASVDTETRKHISTAVQPPQPLDLMDPHRSPQCFRLYLAQAGYLSPTTLQKLWPLPITDALLQELRRVDSLPEYVPVRSTFSQRAKRFTDAVDYLYSQT
ncbi:hypothetical protein HKX48_008074 [Thoreauomyces humboldtii]|nr:hypothetical protein HKX48_008074 [Thoreauomyces humboldtii]